MVNDNAADDLPRADRTQVSRRRAAAEEAPDADGVLRIRGCPDTAHVGRSFPLRGELRIGRDATNSIALNDPEVSAQHALLIPTPKGHVIHDLRSTNGTFVNNDRVDAQQLLVHGAELRLGATTLVYERRRGSDH